MIRRSLVFAAPRAVEIREECIAGPGPGEVLVETSLSAVSSGTELLFYRGQVPGEMPVDASIAALGGRLSYPLKYGYASVGRIVETGPHVSPRLAGRRVFCLHPHESHFVAVPEELFFLPDGLGDENALFLPFMDTAVTLVQDGAPLLGEKVVVMGLGVIGLLTTAVLAKFPLGSLSTTDPVDPRRRRSLAMGASESLSPEGLRGGTCTGVDLVYELSGSYEALDAAVEIAGFSGRVVIGSWYGTKRGAVGLGRAFHRNRVRLIGSQVSSIAPELSGRWDRTRRTATAAALLDAVRPASLITHRFSLDDADRAYRMIDAGREDALQVVMEYGAGTPAAAAPSPAEGGGDVHAGDQP